LADVLPAAVPQLAERLPEYHIRRAWVLLVGPDVARRARPQSLVGGVLHVVVDNSPWLHELTLRAAELTARLREQFEVVHALRFSLGTLAAEPSPPAECRERRSVALREDDRRDIDAAVSAISDPALAETARRVMLKARRYPVDARGGTR
jgi:hypothetical protein